MTELVKTVVGFDFGTKWIGVAVGQTLTRQANPLAAIRNNDWKRIESVLHEWRPQVVVVGLPLNMMGAHQAMSARAERFGRQLEGRFGINTVCSSTSAMESNFIAYGGGYANSHRHFLGLECGN